MREIIKWIGCIGAGLGSSVHAGHHLLGTPVEVMSYSSKEILKRLRRKNRPLLKKAVT
jgi:hypothetical protein